jgi:hypothetical protein
MRVWGSIISKEKMEAISRIEKWSEVKPPARWAYAPEGTATGGHIQDPVTSIQHLLAHNTML